MKKTILSLFMLIACSVTAMASKENRDYELSVKRISNVKHGKTYQVNIHYSSDTNSTLPLANEFRFKGFEDNAGFVEEMKSVGTIIYIKFKRRDTAQPIEGGVNIQFYASPSNGNGGLRYYSLPLEYAYSSLWNVDPGSIKGPSGFHAKGKWPGTIVSVYEAIPLEGTVEYSWEKKSGREEWHTLEGENRNSLSPDTIGYVSDYYRRKATDSQGKYAYSNVVEIMPILSAGEIGIRYADGDTSMKLVDVVSPNSSEADITWECSTDLEKWDVIPGSMKNASVTRPNETTYYRRVITTLVEDNDGERIVAYSNIACYNTEQPAGISTMRYWSADSCTVDYTYVDGLGRRMQSVGKEAAMDGKDIITSYLYDNKGRETGVMLPFCYDSNGGFARNVSYKSSIFHGDSHAATRTVYESSPLDRTIATYKPGDTYQGDASQHCSVTEYGLNMEGEVIRLTSTPGGFASCGFYPASTLRRTIFTDEDGASLASFTDCHGKTILERRTIDEGVFADTYFIYDSKHRLTSVISPNGSAMLACEAEYNDSSSFVKEHCYIYSYDLEDRLTMKRLPGRCAEFYEYDTEGRISVYYDEEMLRDGVKKHFAYDALGREVGFRYASDKGACCQQRLYYDNYSAPGALSFFAVDGFVAEGDLASSVKGKLTHERTFEIYSERASEVRERTYYYDKRGRCVQTVTRYPMSVGCRTSIKYDYAGNPLKRLEVYSLGEKAVALLTECTYDNRGRKLTERTCVNGEEVGYAAFTYDEQGRVQKTRLGNNVEITAAYNLQGWLTEFAANRIEEEELFGNGVSITRSTIFNEMVRYYNTLDSLSTPLYAGRIAETDWKRKLAFYENDRFVYGYDKLGRVASTMHRITGNRMSSEGWFTELDKYDRNGNILSQEIALDGDVDSRSYSLCGNRVASLTVNGVEMGMAEYDSRGNITKIPGKDLQIVYNLCNLPRSIKAGDGTTVNYSYLSDGTKFLAVSDNGEKFLYAGSLRLKLGDAWAIPESFAIAGGRVTNKNGCWLTEYYITDHLGSVRAVVDGEGNTLATFDYTPYGELLVAADSTAAGNDYLFAGKEQQGKLGASELYDSQARFMGTDGRFLSIDPLAENYYHVSPYAYCASDPVNLVDPDGRKIYFAEGVPEWFKERFAETIKYMNEKGTSWIFKKLQDSDVIYYIDYVEKITYYNRVSFDPNKKKINWNPDLFVKTTNGTIMYPATILAHEGAHALQHEKYDYCWNEKAETNDPEYNNLLEREVITKYEQEAAIRHGDICNGNVTRKNHYGKYKVLSKDDYKNIFNNTVTNEIPEINRELIYIYLLNSEWIKLYLQH